LSQLTNGSTPAFWVHSALPPKPIYQTLFPIFLRVWFRDWVLILYWADAMASVLAVAFGVQSETQFALYETY